MDELDALDCVRDELEPLEPTIGEALRLADYVFGGFVADIAVQARTDDSVEGVVEALKLFAEVESVLARATERARTHAGNVERRWRTALVDAATSKPADGRVED